MCDPAALWDWLGPYLDDEEEVRVEGGVRPTVWTIGKVCKTLLTDQKWLGTMLPRIPVPVMRDLEVKIKQNVFPGGGADDSRQGGNIRARSRSPRHPPASGFGGGRGNVTRDYNDDLDYGDEPSRKRISSRSRSPPVRRHRDFLPRRDHDGGGGKDHSSRDYIDVNRDYGAGRDIRDRDKRGGSGGVGYRDSRDKRDPRDRARDRDREYRSGRDRERDYR
ncbi:PRP38 pre-mRNA processing factor 38 domain-containing protein B [Physocladia obscura]|uniref:Pre-mRNA-splicing factor 38 n=1 Tax=Physocladia obscura TaxID=109957 RepID=A0AAD5TAE6_9FUNG|nr:PRP38 pre-mRNA processing factor 38 domain-containing protein B [Physocladia obscura]